MTESLWRYHPLSFHCWCVLVDAACFSRQLTWCTRKCRSVADRRSSKSPRRHRLCRPATGNFLGAGKTMLRISSPLRSSRQVDQRRINGRPCGTVPRSLRAWATILSACRCDYKVARVFRMRTVVDVPGRVGWLFYISLPPPPLASQYGGQCFAGKSSPYAALGRAVACSQGGSPLGGSYTNQVLQLVPRGCTPPCTVRSDM